MYFASASGSEDELWLLSLTIIVDYAGSRYHYNSLFNLLSFWKFGLDSNFGLGRQIQIVGVDLVEMIGKESI